MYVILSYLQTTAVGVIERKTNSEIIDASGTRPTLASGVEVDETNFRHATDIEMDEPKPATDIEPGMVNEEVSIKLFIFNYFVRIA